MPWQDMDVMNLREQFVREAQENRCSFASLCRRYEISRKSGYKWIQRFKDEGILGLDSRSKCPARLRVTSEDWVQLILETRDQFPAWGARKLRHYLINEGHESVPSESTFNRTLNRHQRIDLEASSKRTHFIRFERSKPMELLQMDFKGHFRTGEGRCHPLTLLDDHSRFSLCLKSCPGETREMVQEGLTDAFRENGLPEGMTMDNGPPWKGSPPFVLSRLTIWLMRLGIRVSHSRPYHPQTQGKDERFHRSLKEEVLRYNNFQSLQDAQAAFDEWRYLYNNKRPHEGIGMQRPCDRFQKSTRPFPEKLPPIEYDIEDEVRRVQHNGEIDFKGYRIFVGEHFYQQHIAVRESQTDGIYDMYFCKTRIKSANLRHTRKR